MINVLVTGANGQLANCLQKIASENNDLNLIYTGYHDLDITDLNQVKSYFKNKTIQYCINCAAYTAVDKAEEDEEKAFKINGLGPRYLAEVCRAYNTVLIHISTDFVFDGTKMTPYKETDVPKPLGVYGRTKLKGEQNIQEVMEEYFIIRTSWLYSPFGGNFMKTMLNLAKTKDSISVVDDQKGTPTNALDLAKTILTIIKENLILKESNTGNNIYGIYHFSNEGACSWYDFAKKIFQIYNVGVELKGIPTSGYPTPAQRPMYSVLDKTKITETFGLTIDNWQDSLFKLNKF